MFLCPPLMSLRCWLPRWWIGWPVSPTYCSLHLLHSIRYITLLVLHVVCCRSVIVSPVVLLLTVPVNCPYVLQQLHLISALQGQNPEWVSCDGFCFLCLWVKWILRFLLVWNVRPQIAQVVSDGIGMCGFLISCGDWSDEGVVPVANGDRSLLWVSICVKLRPLR